MYTRRATAMKCHRIMKAMSFFKLSCCFSKAYVSYGGMHDDR
ncbi:hypothetical protein QSI_0011 [Clostridioides difficile P28]|nr:hypothetical protein QSI_0011 [Clostridioides difficile P28]